jgi:hypothetical protein
LIIDILFLLQFDIFTASWTDASHKLWEKSRDDIRSANPPIRVFKWRRVAYVRKGRVGFALHWRDYSTNGV